MLLLPTLLIFNVGLSTAQESYTYTVSHTRTVPINWRPDEKTMQRYTVSVSPLRLASHGLKFDFEYELPRPGHWLGTSLTVYVAPERRMRSGYWSYDDYNNRASFNSAFDDYNRMWGVGTSAMFKNTFSRRGWYFSTGVTLEFFRVGLMQQTYVPYVEDGLTYYEQGYGLETKSYLKPTVQINIGKHMAVSERCFFDLYAGVGISYSLYADNGRHQHYYGGGSYGGGWSENIFDEIGGFAYRGLTPTGGFRFGVLLWK